VDEDGGEPQELVNRVLQSGRAWCSTTVLRGTERVLRACVTNYATQEEDVSALVEALNKARG
jgi:hypothetical protein